jgi:ribonuclease P protein subunit POP4
MTTPPPKTTSAQHIAYTLLARANSPTLAESIFQENVIRRPLLIRKTALADRPNNERETRRRVREKKVTEKARRKHKPRPLSAKDKRALGIHQIPADQQKYRIFLPLHRLWLGYMRELLGVDQMQEKQRRLDHANAGSSIASADCHGAMVEVVKSRCVERVGIKGIVAKETRGTFEVITESDELKGNGSMMRDR